MSNRFLRWAEEWIEEHIPPGGNTDIESHEARAKRMMDQMFDEAAEANFPDYEMKEEEKRIAPLVVTAVSDGRDFDIDVYALKVLLARENEDGD